MVAGLIIVFLIAAPVLVAVAGHWTSTAGTRQQRAEMTWRQVPASPGPRCLSYAFVRPYC